MILRAITWLISVVSWLVPRNLRLEWRQEWLKERRHRAQLGSRPSELRRHTFSCLRDAAWVRRRNPVPGPFSPPFRAEIAAFILVSVFFAVAGGFRRPSAPYRNADRVVFFRRG